MVLSIKELNFFMTGGWSLSYTESNLYTDMEDHAQGVFLRFFLFQSFIDEHLNHD